MTERTYTITKNDETGDVTITYSEPEGLKNKDNRPVHFFWTTTVAPDGISTTTPLMIVSPVQPENGEKPGVVNINEISDADKPVYPNINEI